MIASPYLDGRDRYERVTDAWVDNSSDELFTHTVRLADDDHTVELTADCTPSPGYEIVRARARVLAGPADAAIAADLEQLAGARMVAGFTRLVAQRCGAREGAPLFVDTAIEVARLARQVAKLPSAVTADLVPGDAERCWQLDTDGWVDLPNSCFTYSAAGRALLGTRPVVASAGLELYTPPRGGRRIFVRRRLLRLVRTGDRLDLFHSMHDNVHGFDLHYQVDGLSGRIAAADSITSRLPYAGLCDEPQRKVAALIGDTVDGELRRRVQALIGGESGCAQLYDLTSDLLKLLTFA